LDSRSQGEENRERKATLGRSDNEGPERLLERTFAGSHTNDEVAPKPAISVCPDQTAGKRHWLLDEMAAMSRDRLSARDLARALRRLIEPTGS
jgi:hypothetical protein